MTTIYDIEKYCNEILQPQLFEDATFNGIQIDCGREIKKVMTGVKPSKELFEKAVKNNADLVLTHEGFKFGRELWTLRDWRWRQAKILLDRDVGLICYHLPLDAHPEIGNNANLAKIIGLQNLKPTSVGFIGELKKEAPIGEIAAKITDAEKIIPTRDFDGDKKVRKVAVLSGSVSSFLKDDDWLRENDFDLIVTGEVTDHRPQEAAEIGFEILCFGHNPSEMSGVRALGAKIAQKFGVEHEFVKLDS